MKKLRRFVGSLLGDIVVAVPTRDVLLVYRNGKFVPLRRQGS